MKAVVIASLFILPTGGVVQAKGFHDNISSVFHGTWAPSLAACRDADGVEKLSIDDESVNYYEGNDYLLLGIEFGGAMTKRGGSGSLFNGRFTSRMETNILGEHNIRMEVDDANKNVLYRYPIGEDGEPIASHEVRSVRCTG
ncbi:hypothetical protein E5673_18490 [Sphingomonas sp. PAMC26645]|uniref:hypothetical protein n=1 Tax=Sphingomonas sp. PAMC26645 TaxID=2565555 RepID=UPI00109D8708|nr:hypothetical protein [Sphingomonas sp. PAMC26645]QCB43961.1 hypothetical protein E5673_18490 [Sphingomonas sp. PAMC26645]